MLGYYNYTVWLTYISLLSGGVGICFAFRGHPVIAVICLIISGICDMFDGRVARTKKNRNKNECVYGIQIDSLSDLICFGVLPVSIGISVGLSRLWFVPIFALFILFGMIRLSYYNVLELDKLSMNEEIEDGVIFEEEDLTELDKNPKPKKSFFVGVPITTSAIVFPLLFCFKTILDAKVFAIIYCVLLVIVGILYVVKIKIPKPNFLATIILAVLGLALMLFLIVINLV
ncbi:MAG: CDP-alcohol phosphatidyltransferase family protein [Anaeroplasmataceae bacterium]